VDGYGDISNMMVMGMRCYNSVRNSPLISLLLPLSPFVIGLKWDSYIRCFDSSLSSAGEDVGLLLFVLFPPLSSHSAIFKFNMLSFGLAL
jgi:hypothetical protein